MTPTHPKSHNGTFTAGGLAVVGLLLATFPPDSFKPFAALFGGAALVIGLRTIAIARLESESTTAPKAAVVLCAICFLVLFAAFW